MSLLCGAIYNSNINLIAFPKNKEINKDVENLAKKLLSQNEKVGDRSYVHDKYVFHFF